MKDSEKQKIFEGGGVLFVIGLLALWQGSVEGAIFLCGIGLVMMASVYPDVAKDLLRVFFQGFLALLRTIFPRIF